MNFFLLRIRHPPLWPSGTKGVVLLKMNEEVVGLGGGCEDALLSRDRRIASIPTQNIADLEVLNGAWWV
jgi:hypothetical protein